MPFSPIVVIDLAQRIADCFDEYERQLLTLLTHAAAPAPARHPAASARTESAPRGNLFSSPAPRSRAPGVASAVTRTCRAATL